MSLFLRNEPSDDAFLCKVFPASLGNLGLTWFNQLPAQSIFSFDSLCDAFMARFVTSNKHEKEIDSFLALRKRNDEMLRQYACRYWELFNEIESCDGVISARGFKLSLTSQDEQVYNELARHKPNSIKDLMTRIEGWCQLIKSKAKRGIEKPTSSKTASASAAAPALVPILTPKKQVNNIKQSPRKGPKPGDFNAEKTVFTIPIYRIIDQLVVGGHLGNLIDHEKTSTRAQRAKNHTEEEVQMIHVIHSPLNSEGARMIRAKLNDASSSKQLPHNDALVVTLRIETFNVRRVLVDQGSLVEVMYYYLFKDLKILDTNLHPSEVPLIEFNGALVWPLDMITLPPSVPDRWSLTWSLWWSMFLALSKSIQETVPVQVGLNLSNLFLVFHSDRVPAFVVALIPRELDLSGSGDPQGVIVLLGLSGSALGEHPFSVASLEIGQLANTK
ncbi:uncharacterized protein LOC131327744 [Rhododendron vialii]|uniref:uncharacterized protein LOC131327744 n=1 Tax=Rhododendron vialii TaxID=182163 RepID=UPI00265EF5C5|nr:uncharacterized protein LOC131327744 [Rhododendron vialii]